EQAEPFDRSGSEKGFNGFIERNDRDSERDEQRPLPPRFRDSLFQKAPRAQGVGDVADGGQRHDEAEVGVTEHADEREERDRQTGDADEQVRTADHPAYRADERLRAERNGANLPHPFGRKYLAQRAANDQAAQKQKCLHQAAPPDSLVLCSVRETTATPTQMTIVPIHRASETCSPSSRHDINAFSV